MTLYKDCLGILNSKATISVFGSNYGQVGTGSLVLKTTNNCPENGTRWPYISADVSDIISQMELNGWECTTKLDGYNAPVINCIHIETQNAIDAKLQKINDKFANAELGYIRFGKCPKNGISINHRDNTPENGVSVFEAEFVGKEYRLLLTDFLQVTYVSISDRPAYRIYGDVVGIGADGEPVLKVKKSVKL